jgi:hypothetical protein
VRKGKCFLKGLAPLWDPYYTKITLSPFFGKLKTGPFPKGEAGKRNEDSFSLRKGRQERDLSYFQRKRESIKSLGLWIKVWSIILATT